MVNQQVHTENQQFELDDEKVREIMQSIAPSDEELEDEEAGEILGLDEFKQTENVDIQDITATEVSSDFKLSPLQYLLAFLVAAALLGLIYLQYLSASVKPPELTLQPIAERLVNDVTHLGNSVANIALNPNSKDINDSLSNRINSRFERLENRAQVEIGTFIPFERALKSWQVIQSELPAFDDYGALKNELPDINAVVKRDFLRLDSLLTSIAANADGESAPVIAKAIRDIRGLAFDTYGNSLSLKPNGDAENIATVNAALESINEQAGTLHSLLRSADSDTADRLLQFSTQYTQSVNAQVNNINAVSSLNQQGVDLSHKLMGLQEQVASTPVQQFQQREAAYPSWLPWLISGLGLLALVFLVIITRKRHLQLQAMTQQLSDQSDEAVINLLDEIGDLANGDLTVNANVTDDITGAIADSINFAVAEMRDLVSGIQSAFNRINSATDATELQIAELLNANDEHNANIKQVGDDANVINDAIDKMNSAASASADQAKLSLQVASRGADSVHSTVTTMQNTRQQIQETAKRIKRLGESSQQINEIVNLIQDVSEQTNVLSLNASIQAAMAGEAGRGFAVVAEEVQRLADRANLASNDINEIVQNIQRDTKDAIMSMETTTEEVVKGAEKADEAGSALNEIQTMSESLFATISNLAREAKLQSAGTGQVTNQVIKLQESTTNTDIRIAEVASSLQSMREVVADLDKSVSGFKLPIDH